jgi:hypothetical protein
VLLIHADAERHSIDNPAELKQHVPVRPNAGLGSARVRGRPPRSGVVDDLDGFVCPLSKSVGKMPGVDFFPDGIQLQPGEWRSRVAVAGPEARAGGRQSIRGPRLKTPAARARLTAPNVASWSTRRFPAIWRLAPGARVTHSCSP